MVKIQKPVNRGHTQAKPLESNGKPGSGAADKAAI